MGPAASRRDEVPIGDLADVRERLARLETSTDAHERASVERHAVLASALPDVRARLEKAEDRSWRVMLAVAAVAAGGGIGGAELVKVLVGGG